VLGANQPESGPQAACDAGNEIDTQRKSKYSQNHSRDTDERPAVISDDGRGWYWV
jgi:hypothetical protein